MAYIPLKATELSDIPRNKAVNAETTNAFTNIVGNVVTIQNDSKYVLTKTIDFGQLEFVTSPGGEVEITSENLVASKFVTGITGTTPLFSGDAGRLVIRNIDITFTSGSGNLFDISSSTVPVPLILIENCRISGGNSLGNIGTALVVIRNTAFINWDEGLTFTGNGQLNSTGVFVDSINFINVGGTQLTATGSQSIVQITNCLSTPENGGFFLDLDNVTINRMQPVDERSFFVQDNIISTSAGGAFLKSSSIDQTDPAAFFSTNETILDSYSIGISGFTGGTTETVLSDTSTFVKIAGTYIDGNSERFEFSNGVGTYTGPNPISVKMKGLVKLKLEPGIETDIIEVTLFKNSSEISISRIQQNLTAVFQTPTSPEFNPEENVLLEQNDTFEIRVRNISNATNVVVTDAKISVRE